MSANVFAIVLFAALLHATWNALLKSGDAKLASAIRLCVVTGLMALPALPFLPLPAPASWGYLSASAVIHVLYFVLLALAYRAADMSFAYPLMRGAAPLMTALVIAVLVSEPMSVTAWLSLGLLCVGVVALAKGGAVSAKAWLLGLSNAAVIVCYTVVDGLGVRLSGSAAAYVLWLFVLTALPMTGLGMVMQIPWRTAMPELTRSAVCGACSVASYGLALWAMTVAPIALVAALRETSVLFGVLIAATMLHESLGLRRWLAAGLIALGVVALKLS